MEDWVYLAQLGVGEIQAVRHAANPLHYAEWSHIAVSKLPGGGCYGQVFRAEQHVVPRLKVELPAACVCKELLAMLRVQEVLADGGVKLMPTVYGQLGSVVRVHAIKHVHRVLEMLPKHKKVW